MSWLWNLLGFGDKGVNKSGKKGSQGKRERPSGGTKPKNG